MRVCQRSDGWRRHRDLPICHAGHGRSRLGGTFDFRIKALNLPENVLEVIVLADGDDVGEDAARECAHRWQRKGRRVRIARPLRGQDFNDMLMRPMPQSGAD